tara:strand:+ start:352 stop:534 length:183 start_codon:yes stop_codon:yes gene_type:complete
VVGYTYYVGVAGALSIIGDKKTFVPHIFVAVYISAKSTFRIADSNLMNASSRMCWRYDIR